MKLILGQEILTKWDSLERKLEKGLKRSPEGLVKCKVEVN